MAFFENLGRKITDAGQNVAQQTKNLTELSRLNNLIAAQEKQLTELFAGIGKAYYDQHKDDETAESRQAIAAVTELYAQIQAEREQITALKGAERCSHCGAELPKGAQFCSVCGSKQESAQRFCEGCGAPLNPDDMFCTSCGKRLVPAAEQMPPEAPETPAEPEAAEEPAAADTM